MQQESTNKTFYIVSVLLLWLGNLVAGVGQFHPPTSEADLGVTESGNYWMAFAILSTDDPWLFIHGAMVAGPLLIVLGLAGIYRFLQEKGEKNYSFLAILALLIGALFWSIAFVIDGFGTEALGRYLNEGIAEVNILVMNVRLLQVIVLRLALTSVVFTGIGMVLLSASIWVTSLFSYRVRVSLCAVGVITGVWPLIAMFTGIFVPGPFVSDLWVSTAGVINVWFFVIGLLVFKMVRQSQPAPETIVQNMHLVEEK